MEERDYHLLQKGKTLNNRYIIEKILGEGGFGITYMGTDKLLGVRVAIKEYYPQGVVTRNNSVDDVVTATYAKQKDIFNKGKEKFLDEARVIARFNDQDGIVNVTDFFEANNTAYIVMEYLDGITLKEYISTNGTLAPEDILELMSPVLESLDEVHKQGVIHRDISPDNIMLLKGEKVKLMDFGAARDYTEFGEKSLSIVLKPGFAPEEQYRSRGVQGPWTDIYALSATIYKCITGITPEEALQRVIEDGLKKPSEYCKDIPKGMEKALMKGMEVFQKNRYQNLGEFCQDLYSDFEDVEEKNKKLLKLENNSQAIKNKNQVRDNEELHLPQGVSTILKKIGIQKMTRKQGKIAGSVIFIVIVALVIVLSTSRGRSDNNDFTNIPTEREMVSDIVKDKQWAGTILNLSIVDDDINRQYETYTAECEIESKQQGGSGITSKVKITYKLENSEWIFVKCEKLN